MNDFCPCDSYKNTAVGKFKVISLPSTMNIDEFSSSSMNPWLASEDEVIRLTNFYLARALGQEPSGSAYPTIAPPTFPYGHGTPILIDGIFEGSLIENQVQHGTGNEYNNGDRLECSYFFSTITCTDY